MPELLINDKYVFRHRGTESDIGVISQILQAEDYHLGRLRRQQELLSIYENSAACPLIVDCGANIGASAVWFALNYPKSRIVALEPERQNYELLVQNTECFPNVTALRAAIGPRRGRIFLTDPGAGEWGYRTKPSPEAGDKVIEEVDVVTLRDVLRGSEPDRKFILKIDIEGAEQDLFGSNTREFGEFALIIIELHDWLLTGRATSRNFLKWHAGTDRDFVYVGENVFSIKNR